MSETPESTEVEPVPTNEDVCEAMVGGAILGSFATLLCVAVGVTALLAIQGLVKTFSR